MKRKINNHNESIHKKDILTVFQDKRIKINHIDLKSISFGDYIIATVCEYIFDINDQVDIDKNRNDTKTCEHFINAIGMISDKYKHLFTIYNYPDSYNINARYMRIFSSNGIINLPPKLVSLELDMLYQDEFVINMWPNTLIRFEIGMFYDKKLCDIPNSIIKIKVHRTYLYLDDLFKMYGNKIIVWGCKVPRKTWYEVRSGFMSEYGNK
jgi:hypothetical protein